MKSLLICSELRAVLFALVLSIVTPFALHAQAAPVTSSNGSIRGQVVDPSGAVVSGAKVAIVQGGKATRAVSTNSAGNYEIGNLPAGKYTVAATAKGFGLFVKDGVDVNAGQASQFNISLEIPLEQQKVDVEGVSPTLDTSPASNASAIVLTGKDLEALPDDPDELQSDLEALAGPSVGPNGGQFYVDGFTAGQLPPKSSIREIRINQNPFSAEYDKVGYGRIEIFTKPGTDKFHGQASIEGNSSGLNTRNPFIAPDATQPYYSVIYQGNVGGPINKKTSFFFNVQRRDINEVAAVNTSALDSDLQPIQLSESVPNPRTRTNIGPRIDYQVTPNNTLSLRYQYYRDTQQNAGVGGTVLPEAGYDTETAEHTVQVSDTQILGAKVVNETRFQYLRDSSDQNPVNSPLQTLPPGFTTNASISVYGAFTGGRAATGFLVDHQDHYELQNYTSIAQGKHFVKFGGRLRVIHEVNTAGTGFNGAFNFASILDYATAVQNLAQGVQLAATPNRFSLEAPPTVGGQIPTVPVSVADAGLYVQDDWKVRPNFTLSGGLRFETQNAIHDHGDWAPRFGFAWGIGGSGKTPPKTVLRAGFGLFYDRFTQDLVLNADRLNGVTQQSYTSSCTPPCKALDFFPNVPAVSQLPPSQTVSTVYRIDPNLHSPYVIQTAVSVERQVTRIANVTVTYLNSRGVHEFVSLIANASTGPTYPFPPPPNPLIYQYSSEGVYRQNQLITNFNVRAGARLSLFGYYSLNYAKSDSSGASYFPSDSQNLGLDYGRASFDIRDRVFFGGSISLPKGFRISPFLIFNSGSPYNVTIGQDLASDLQFNLRPSLGPYQGPTPCPWSASSCAQYSLPTSPSSQIPINNLTGPNQFTLNLRFAKTFGFGKETSSSGGGPRDGGPGGGGPGGGGGGPHGGGGGGGPSGPIFSGRGGPGGIFGGAATTRRYNLTFSVNARNIFNIVNDAAPVGALPSSDFGKSIAIAGGAFSSAAANRKIELQAMFSF